MKTLGAFLFLLLLSFSEKGLLFAGQLNYPIGKQVEQRIVTDFLIQQDFGNQSSEVRVVQEVFSYLKRLPDLSNQEKGMRLEFFSTRVLLRIESPEVVMIFDTDYPAPFNPYLAELKEHLNRRQVVFLGEGGELDRDLDLWHFMVKGLPFLRSLLAEDFLAEVFKKQFAFAGTDLELGKESVYDFDLEAPFHQKINLLYCEKALTNKHLEAEFSGKILANKNVNFGVFLKDFQGDISGKASWDLSNAFLYQLDSLFKYTGRLGDSNKENPIRVEIKQRITST